MASRFLLEFSSKVLINKIYHAATPEFIFRVVAFLFS
jgi:hypothetical protein